MKKITGKIDVSEIKRLYVDADFYYNCPKCNKMIDPFENYLSYAEEGYEDTLDIYCYDCHTEFFKKIKILSAYIEVELEE